MMKLTFFNLATAAVALFAAYAAFLYWRPPKGDLTPLPEEWLLRQSYDRRGFNPHSEDLK